MNSIAFPSLSDGLILFYAVLLVSIILFPVDYYYGRKGLILSLAILFAIAALLFFWLVALGAAFKTNGGLNYGTEQILYDTFKLTIPTVIALVAYGWIVHQFVQPFRSAGRPGLTAILLMIFAWSTPVFLYGYHTVRLNWKFNRYIRVSLHLLAPRHLSIHMKGISFQTGDRKTVSFSPMLRDFSRTLSDEILENYELFSIEERLIPADSDHFFLEYDLDAERRRYADSFQFPQERLKIERSSYSGFGTTSWPGQKQINDLYLVIHPLGKADLLVDEGIERPMVADYFDIASTEVPPDDAGRNEVLKRAKKATADSLKRWNSAGEPFDWRLDLTDFPEIKYVMMTTTRLNRHIRSKKLFSGFQKLPLPVTIELRPSYYGKRVTIWIDRMTIFNAVAHLQTKDPGQRDVFRIRKMEHGGERRFSLEVETEDKKHRSIIPIRFSVEREE